MHKVLTDQYINGLFKDTNFGESVNNSVAKKRNLIAETLKAQLEGYWSGKTIYHICVHGGFLVDTKFGEQKKLTALGVSFLQNGAQ